MIHCNAETAALVGKQGDPVRETQKADISVACHNEHGIPCPLDHRHEYKRIWPCPLDYHHKDERVPAVSFGPP